jgi:PiT family inorganic phosphate transporter
VGSDHGHVLLGVTLSVALVFAWTNGFNDAGNSVATPVNTRALTPLRAVLLAAALNFTGALLGEGLAATIGDALVRMPTSQMGVAAVLAGLLAAIGWNALMWSRGVPSSSSHALLGGLTGAALATGAMVDGPALVRLVLLPLVLSPLFGALFSVLIMALLLRVFAHATYSRAIRRFRLAQTVSASSVSLAHGLQDGQKTMGVMLLALISAGEVGAGDGVPWQVQISAALALAAGTYAGGWRIARTLGRRLVRVDSVTGFVAETVSSTLLYISAYVFNAPVSTTHTVASSITAAGATAHGVRAVRWRVLRGVGAAWLITLPCTALLGAGVASVFRLL